MGSYSELKGKILSRVAADLPRMTALNDHLADHPEVSGKEFETSRTLVQLLREYGFEVEYPFAGLDTAFRGTFGPGGHTWKCAILTEFDALPELGHACGHCLSGSISMLAAAALRDLQDELDTDIEIIGTPMEEDIGGKAIMARKGVFSGYDMAVMVHMYDANLTAPKLLAMDSFMYYFHGKSAHASNAPWDGNNALNGAMLMLHAMDMLRQHLTPDVRMHSVIRNGGEAPNIVPEAASAEVYVRALDRTYLNDVIRKVDDCARGAAIATQTTWDKETTAEPYDNLLPNATGLAALAEVFGELGLELNGDPDKIFGSSDVGNVSFVCPTFHPCLQVAPAGTAIHTREFESLMKTDRAHKALQDGASLIALLIAKIFSDPAKVRAVRADFEAVRPH